MVWAVMTLHRWWACWENAVGAFAVPKGLLTSPLAGGDTDMKSAVIVMVTLTLLVGFSGVTFAEPAPSSDGGDCNGLYDTRCTCPSGNFTCDQGQECSTWAVGYCIVGGNNN